MPPTGLGPCCIPGPGDNASTPHSCSNQAFDQCGEIGPEGCSCHPCPESPGSDCSRCANCGLPGFEPPCPSCQGVDWHGNAVKDRVKIPASLAPGNYVLGFRYEYDSEDFSIVAVRLANLKVSLLQLRGYGSSVVVSLFLWLSACATYQVDLNGSCARRNCADIEIE